MWTCQNKILHHEDNHYTAAEDTILSDKLRWYKNNQATALGYNVQHFADIKEQDLQRWSRETKREWISFFNVAEQRERQRVKQSQQKQKVLSSYFLPPSLW